MAEGSRSPAGEAEQAEQHTRMCNELVSELGRVLVGQDAMISRLLVGLLSGGHVLLEGVPGLAKTLAVRSLARAIDTGFSRIQFTPDMLPADVVGTEIFHPKDGSYSVKQGPPLPNNVMANVASAVRRMLTWSLASRNIFEVVLRKAASVPVGTWIWVP